MTSRFASRDLWAGLLFAAFGATGLWVGRDYPIGSAMRMGPGYFPMLLSWSLVLVGGAIAVRGALQRNDPSDGWRFRPLILICAALVAFAGLLETMGLVAATAALILIGASAGPQFRWFEALALAATLAAAAVALFSYALKLTMPVWPAWPV